MIRRVFCLLACTALLVAVAPIASATDGVILINQTTAVRGLPGCNSAGMPIVICQAGSYRLASNLIAGGADGIDITADGVTLDLNGFTIAQSSGGSGDGINSNHNGITVSNGVVSGFQRGLALTGTGVMVSGVRAMNNTLVNIQIGAGDISNSSALNGSNGIRMVDGVVSDSTIAGGTDDGIEFAGSGLVRNNLLDNRYTCVMAEGGPVTVIDNVFETNCATGMDLRSGGGFFSGNDFDNVTHPFTGGDNGGQNAIFNSAPAYPPSWNLTTNKQS